MSLTPKSQQNPSHNYSYSINNITKYKQPQINKRVQHSLYQQKDNQKYLEKNPYSSHKSARSEIKIRETSNSRVTDHPHQTSKQNSGLDFCLNKYYYLLEALNNNDISNIDIQKLFDLCKELQNTQINSLYVLQYYFIEKKNKNLQFLQNLMYYDKDQVLRKLVTFFICLIGSQSFESQNYFCEIFEFSPSFGKVNYSQQSQQQIKKDCYLIDQKLKIWSYPAIKQKIDNKNEVQPRQDTCIKTTEDDEFNDLETDERVNQELINFDVNFPDPLYHCVGFQIKDLPTFNQLSTAEHLTISEFQIEEIKPQTVSTMSCNSPSNQENNLAGKIRVGTGDKNKISYSNYCNFINNEKHTTIGRKKNSEVVQNVSIINKDSSPYKLSMNNSHNNISESNKTPVHKNQQISSFNIQDSDKMQDTDMHLKTSEGESPNINRIPSTSNSLKKTFLESFKEKHDIKQEVLHTKIQLKPLSNLRVSGNFKTSSPYKQYQAKSQKPYLNQKSINSTKQSIVKVNLNSIGSSSAQTPVHLRTTQNSQLKMNNPFQSIPQTSLSPVASRGKGNSPSFKKDSDKNIIQGNSQKYSLFRTFISKSNNQPKNQGTKTIGHHHKINTLSYVKQ